MKIEISQPWNLSANQTLKDLGTSKSGLSHHEATKRLQIHGHNDIERVSRRSGFSIFLSQYKNPLILILIGVSITSFLIGDRLGSGIILVMIAVNSLMGFIQEFRSEKAVELLRRKASLKSRVIRNGQEETIHAVDLVPGDVVKISQGSVVPADLRLIVAKNLAIDESVITGESFPSEKTAETLKIKKGIPQELKNVAFMGTNVETGDGFGVVFATASNTEFGKTALALKSAEPETEFQTGTRKFGNFLAILILSLVVFIFIVNIWLKPIFLHSESNVLEALLFSLALAIGITPELLPIIITINLSQGAMLMSKKHVIVKKLMSIEDLGNADVLCTDKTGTITEGKIFLEDYFNYDGKQDSKLLLYGLLSNTDEGQTAAHPLEAALARAVETRKEIVTEAEGFEKTDELPFDFERKRNSVLVQNKEGALLISKGATEHILPICTSLLINGDPTLLLEGQRRLLRERFIQLSGRGLRILAVAVKNTEAKKKLSKEDENGLTFLGFLVFSDRPKHAIQETVQGLEDLGVQIKILTGDNEYVAKYICDQVGIKVKNIVTGESIDTLSDEELASLTAEATIFAKVTPEHKLRIVKAIKAAGHTVAFMGDGANDAPALKAADVGICVDTAVDIAKEAADVIILRKGLDVLIEAVKDGRRTFGNSMKYIFATSSANFGNMFSLAGASLFLRFIPLLPAQVILLNLLSDVPSLAVSTDNVDSEYLKKPKHWDIHAIGRFMIPFGLISSIFDFLTFFLLLYATSRLADPRGMFRTGWFIESLATEIFVLYLIRTRRPFWQSRPSNLLIILGLGSLVAGLALVYLPISKVFQFVAPPVNILAIIALLLLAYLCLSEAAKRIYYKKINI
ncbi:MAG: magnesium-translocating P-type ATPase [Candidatus Woykebacteria bacterium GWB1_45_5]|uniref:Magnesium-transporting ATPase, P-type 1 n=2 Tax=Candidatus Woykeibacteriota TaxID=1817899 RepID=A0A1G1W4U4_9BACT|nr:MAG: magnesium-translocating P-type ATPase [Candidatus Woykebacteria bacterium GWA1_44_8]OGY22804.1 MAG: magnesium-translocating P-type ATPase [Candidatus Woykebacteria bacterium GWB1_45_5]